MSLFARVMLMGAMLSTPAWCWAADPAPKAETAEGAEKPAGEYKTPVTAESVVIPDGTPAELIAAMEGASQKTQESGLEFPDNLRLLTYTMTKAADKLLAHKEATDEQKAGATERKFRVLLQAAQYSPEEFSAPCLAMCEEVAKAQPKTQLGAVAGTFPFYLKVLKSETLPEDAEAQLIALTKQFPASPLLGQLYDGLADRYSSKKDTAKAIAVLESGINTLKELNPDGTSQLEGALARLKLIGSEMELAGPTVDGKSVDLKSMRGKVVLVDFWATWCGPCIAELPNVKAAYEKHHEHGFEIIGVSLDDDAEELKSFVTENKMPWAQIIFADEDERGWKNPLAGKYGVTGIPAMFLVGRDGKVITDQVRGEGVLEKAIEAALAAPAAGASNAAPAAAPKAGG